VALRPGFDRAVAGLIARLIRNLEILKALGDSGADFWPVCFVQSFKPPFLSFRDGPKDQTSDAQLRIGESRDSGFDAAHRPGMTL
jgi:hypothetical protein